MSHLLYLLHSTVLSIRSSPSTNDSIVCMWMFILIESYGAHTFDSKLRRKQKRIEAITCAMKRWMCPVTGDDWIFSWLFDSQHQISHYDWLYQMQLDMKLGKLKITSCVVVDRSSSVARSTKENVSWNSFVLILSDRELMCTEMHSNK